MHRKELKEFRLGKGLTQLDMAKKLGLSLSHYKGIEYGTQDPSFKTLCRFYDVFQNEYDDIWKLFKR